MPRLRGCGDEQSFFFSIAEELCKTSAAERRAQHSRFLIQSPERKRTRSGRSVASSGRTTEVLRLVKEGGSRALCSIAQQFE